MSQSLTVFLAAAVILLHVAHYLFWGFKPIGKAESIKDYAAHGLLIALIVGLIISFADFDFGQFVRITCFMAVFDVYCLALIDAMTAQAGPRKESERN